MKDDRVYLLHIRDCLDRIFEYTREGRAAFLADTRTQDAVIRNLEVIGEAAKNVPEDIRAAHPEIEWRKMAGLRDILIHRYFGIDVEIIWDVLQHKLPGLAAQVRRILGR